MRRNYIERDGRHAEVHEDTVAVAGDRVLRDRRREKIPAGRGYGNGGLEKEEPGC